jgi:hypothetical protein
LELARHPDVQRRLRDEIQNMDELDPDVLDTLPYLNAVLKVTSFFSLVLILVLTEGDRRCCDSIR